MLTFLQYFIDDWVMLTL